MNDFKIMNFWMIFKKAVSFNNQNKKIDIFNYKYILCYNFEALFLYASKYVLKILLHFQLLIFLELSQLFVERF